MQMFSKDCFHRKETKIISLGSYLTFQSVKAVIKNGIISKATVTYVLPATWMQPDI